MVVIHSSDQSELSQPSFDVTEKRHSFCDLKSMIDDKHNGHASSSDMPMQHHQETDRIRRLKITVLSLSGISIRSLENTSHSTSLSPKKKYSISASVSFSGSCDPGDMKVASSSLCSSSGLLSVESRPVIVPDGMSDRLVAVWDESIPSNVDHDLGDLSAFHSVLIGKQKGAISALPKANPHLYVVLREEISDSLSKREAMVGSTAMSTNTIESGTEGSSMVKQISAHIEESDNSESSTSESEARPLSKTMLKSSSVPREIGNQDHMQSSAGQELTFTILNTPSTDKKTAVPEILEMKISLLANQILSKSFDDEYEDANFMTSIYSPSADGSEAVAHLVLFPDILDDPMPDKNNDGRIIQIPVRKSTNQISKSLEKKSSTKLPEDQDATWSRFLSDPKVSIDLDESSMLLIKVEQCSESDEIMFDVRNQTGVADPLLTNIEQPRPQKLGTALSHASATNNLPHAHDSMVGHGDDASISSNVGTAHPKHNTQVTKSSSKQHSSPAYLCSPVFGLDGLLKSFNGMMMHCGDDVRAFQMDDASMDSTIGSNGTL